MSKQPDSIETTGKNYQIVLDSFAKVVIGDENSISFRPTARYSAFGEDGTGFVLHTPTNKNIQPVLADGVLGWDDLQNNIGARFYQHADKGRYERGAAEQELILYAAPQSGEIPFSIEVVGLELLPQGPLSQFELDRGNVRQPEMVGGFAAYHSTKTTMHSIPGDAARYKTGKAFDIPIPTAKDANAKVTNGAWKYQPELSLLKAVFDFNWLQGAAYPVTIGPTVGYSTIGGTQDGTDDYVLATRSTAAGAGDANPGTAYIYGAVSSGTQPVYMGVWVDSGGTDPGGATRLAASSAITLTTTPGWRSAAITWTSITATNYWMGNWSNKAGVEFYYDATGAVGRYANTGANGTPTNPMITTGGAWNNRTSGYVDYTASGGGLSLNYMVRQSVKRASSF